MAVTDLTASIYNGLPVDPSVPPITKLTPTAATYLPGEDEYLVNHGGQDVARVSVNYRPSLKDIFVNWIGGNQLGGQAMRGIMTQLQGLYPEAQTISGERTTGARMGTNQQGAIASVQLPKATVANTLSGAATSPLFSPTLVAKPGSGGLFNEEDYLQRQRENLQPPGQSD